MRGSCLCGDVSWQAEGPLELVAHCHCSRCRKHHGTAYATWAGASDQGYSERGRSARYESSPGFFRCFCAWCGSVVPGDPFEGRIFVPVANFDGDPLTRPVAHIFVASKAPWYEIPDALPQYAEYPPAT